MTDIQESPVIKALIEAKKNFGAVAKDAVNPFHKNRYATLDSINSAVDSSLLEQGLTIVQGVVQRENKNYLVARLVHTSGVYDPEIQESSYELPASTKPQDLGSAMTYGRRYNKCALLDIVADADDDGNSSTTISDAQFKRLVAIAKNKKWEDSEVKTIISNQGFSNGKDLTLSAYEAVCRILNNKKDTE